MLVPPFSTKRSFDYFFYYLRHLPPFLPLITCALLMPIRALLVSEDAMLVRRMTTAVSEFGMQLQSVPQCGVALERLKSDHFQAVMVDCDGIPGGVSVLESVRRSPNHLKSIVFAIIRENATSAIATRVGANFVLSTPINWELTRRTFRVAQNLIHREQRDELREKVRATAYISVDERKEIVVSVMDLSHGGMAIQAPFPLEVNRFLRLRFALPGSKEELICRARVAWTRNNGHGGLEFLRMADRHQDLITQWLGKNCPKRGTSRIN
jgi:ActR/RegA family two-component response regulator